MSYSLVRQDEPEKELSAVRQNYSLFNNGTVTIKRLGQLLLASALLVGLVSVSVLYIAPRSYPSSLSTPTSESATLSSPGKAFAPQCASSAPAPAVPPAPVNPWAPLTPETIASIQHFLEQPRHGLNLSRPGNVSLALSSNIVFLIEAYAPPKAEVLAYLDGPDPYMAPPPEKYARVTVHHGATPEPYVKDYLVGPLPVKQDTQLREHSDVYHRDIPWNARGYAFGSEFQELAHDFISTPGLSDAMEDLFNGTARGRPDDTLIMGASAPFSFDGSFRRMWVTWRRNVPGPFLHPVGFFQYVDVSGNDKYQWKVLKVVYNHQVFPSLADFMEAYRSGNLSRLPAVPEQQAPAGSMGWSSRERPASARNRDLDHLPGPRPVAFAGSRFRLDKERSWASWMGWEMFLGFDRDMGLNLWDVRFRGERIIYQIAPMEALAQYAGNDPLQSTTAWLDSFFGMGTNCRPLMPTYDCPSGAAYLSATTHSAGGTLVRQRAICMFEMDTGRPLSRHWGMTKGEAGSTRGYVFVIRAISTVGNYDYLFDYIFHLDGTIEVRLSASGYLQGGLWEPKQAGYGTRIRENTMGTLHDHVINYKVDLDIAGTANSLLQTTTAQEEVEHPWLDDDWGKKVIQQKITRKFIESEDDARLKYPTNFQGGYAIVNRDEKNAWGVERGYAVHQGYNPVHNTVVGSKRLLKNANWAKYNLAVSRRKETEPRSSVMWNLHLPGAPVVDFDSFFDSENITQEDLVMWVNIGMHHLTQAEDSPHTRTNTATSSFFLTPLNFFDSDVSMDSRNSVLLLPEFSALSPDKEVSAESQSYAYEDYGVSYTHCVPEPPEPFRYGGDQDMAIYDPDGRRVLPLPGAEQQEAEANMYHRVKFHV